MNVDISSSRAGSPTDIEVDSLATCFAFQLLFHVLVVQTVMELPMSSTRRSVLLVFGAHRPTILSIRVWAWSSLVQITIGCIGAIPWISGFFHYLISFILKITDRLIRRKQLEFFDARHIVAVENDQSEITGFWQEWEFFFPVAHLRVSFAQVIHWFPFLYWISDPWIAELNIIRSITFYTPYRLCLA